MGAGCVQERHTDKGSVERQDAGNDQSHESCVKMRGSYRQVDGVDRVELELVSRCSSTLVVPVNPVVALHVAEAGPYAETLQGHFYSLYVTVGCIRKVGSMSQIYPPTTEYDVHYFIMKPGDTSLIAIPLCDTCDAIEASVQSDWNDVVVSYWPVADTLVRRLTQLSRAIDTMPETLLDIPYGPNGGRLVVGYLNGVVVEGSKQRPVVVIDSQSLYELVGWKSRSYYVLDTVPSTDSKLLRN